MKALITSFRFRNVYMVLFTILVLLAAFLSDPDNGFIQNLPFGAGFLATVLSLTKIVIYVSMLHISRKALFDYLDLEELFNKAKETPQGAATALVAVAITMLVIGFLIFATVI